MLNLFKKIILVIAIIVVVVVVVVVVAKKGQESGTETRGPSGSLPIEGMDIAPEIYGFSATIKKIDDKTLILEGNVPLFNPETDSIEKLEKLMLKAVVTDRTKIVKLKFPKVSSEGSGEPVQPEETPVGFDELYVGEKIHIGAFENLYKIIKSQTKFELKHIFIF